MEQLYMPPSGYLWPVICIGLIFVQLDHMLMFHCITLLGVLNL
jgi:hypothetical protein